jgi:NADH dehydrogenase
MKRIIVVGGGFAGAALVRQLASARAKDIEVTLISEDSYTTFNPLLAEVVGAAVFPEHALAPLREFTRGARFVMGRVSAVDFPVRLLHTSSLQGPLAIPYDHLVFAFGNRARGDLIPGMADHGHVLKTRGDASSVPLYTRRNSSDKAAIHPPRRCRSSRRGCRSPLLAV